MLIACLNLGRSAGFQTLLLVLKALFVLGIVLAGAVRLAGGRNESLELTFHGTASEPLQLVLAVYSSLFAFSGFEVLNVVMGELRSGRR